MTDLTSNLRGVLAQTEAVAKMQEKAKRRGEIQQQQTARHVADKVDIQGMQVEEMPETESEHKVNEDEQGKGEESQQDSVTEEEPEASEATDGESEAAEAADSETETGDLTCEEEGKGRLFDKKA
jgi:hypothetical protein